MAAGDNDAVSDLKLPSIARIFKFAVKSPEAANEFIRGTYGGLTSDRYAHRPKKTIKLAYPTLFQRRLLHNNYRANPNERPADVVLEN
jgi:hypothetical protein